MKPIQRPIPRDMRLYGRTKLQINLKYPQPSAYRSGLLVQAYKKAFSRKYGSTKSPYIGKKTQKIGLGRWFSEKWVNQNGKIGYHSKSDVYRPSKRITKKTPTTFKELSRHAITRARRTKYRKGRVFRF